jgi:hypothetical protein
VQASSKVAGGGQAVTDNNGRGLGEEKVEENLAEATLTDAQGPVVFGLPHDLQALRVDDVDVANQISAVIVGPLDLDTAIGLVAARPVQQQLFAVVLVKLNQADGARASTQPWKRLSTMAAGSAAACNFSRKSARKSAGPIRRESADVLRWPAPAPASTNNKLTGRPSGNRTVPVGEAQECASCLLQSLDTAVRNGDALAETGGTELLAGKKAVENR